MKVHSQTSITENTNYREKGYALSYLFIRSVLLVYVLDSSTQLIYIK